MYNDLMTNVTDPCGRNHYYTMSCLAWYNKMARLKNSNKKISAGIIQKKYGKLGKQVIYHITEL